MPIVDFCARGPANRPPDYPRHGASAIEKRVEGLFRGRPVNSRVNSARTWRAAVLLVVVASVAAGCRPLGPRTVAADRLDYSDAIANSWKRQTLLNIVKVRYLDTPIFVDVGQIVAGYSMETALAAAAAGFPYTNTDQLSVQGSTKFTDRPTVTYTPLTGSRFIAGLMTPIQPDALFSAIQSGWPADVLLRQGAGSINGLKNEEGSLRGRSAPDPEFLRVVELMRAVQVSGALSFRVVRAKGGENASLLMFRRDHVDPESAEQMRELGTLLGLDPGLKEYRLVYGSVAENGKEIAVLTRSLLHVMSAMSLRAEVPQSHVAAGRAAPGLGPAAPSAPAGAPPRGPIIRCTAHKPADAYVAVHYRGHWFWIDDRDILAKRDFAFIMLLFTMADTGAERGAPLITIPAQ